MFQFFFIRSIHALISNSARRQFTTSRKLLSTLGQGPSITPPCPKEPIQTAQKAFSFLATPKTWQRLGPLVEMGCNISPPIGSIADIGCDHGLLSMGLAVSGQFHTVVGADISPQALQNALAMKQAMDQRGNIQQCNLDFRLGNGLEALQDSEVNAVCLAGMGVTTMKEILAVKELGRVGCKHVILQPTNSRPRKLCELYDYLQDMGWRLGSERIKYVSGRWYVSVLFSNDDKRSSLSSNGANLLPGACLQKLDVVDPMRDVYNKYVAHHISWLSRDAGVSNLGEEDRRWLALVQSLDHI